MAHAYLHPILRVFGSAVALIILIICLFAGSTPGILSDAEIFRVRERVIHLTGCILTTVPIG